MQLLLEETKQIWISLPRNLNNCPHTVKCLTTVIKAMACLCVKAILYWQHQK